MTARLDDAADLMDLANRLAYVLYGFAVFGASATAAASEALEMSTDKTIGIVSDGVDGWLNTYG